MPIDAPVALLKVPVADRDHVIGPADAPVTLVMYGDYECPHCAKAEVAVRELLARRGEKLRLVYRHFPLAKAHPHARLAAEAAEEAAAEGGDVTFWEMHRLLFDHQKELEPVHLLAYAKQAGLDIPRFRRELESHAHGPRIQEDVSGGGAAASTAPPPSSSTAAATTGGTRWTSWKEQCKRRPDAGHAEPRRGDACDARSRGPFAAARSLTPGDAGVAPTVTRERPVIPRCGRCGRNGRRRRRPYRT